MRDKACIIFLLLRKSYELRFRLGKGLDRLRGRAAGIAVASILAIKIYPDFKQNQVISITADRKFVSVIFEDKMRLIA